MRIARRRWECTRSNGCRPRRCGPPGRSSSDMAWSGATTKFALLGLEEPEKRFVLDFSPGELVDRRVRAVLLDVATGAAQIVVVVDDPR